MSGRDSIFHRLISFVTIFEIHVLIKWNKTPSGQY